VHVHPGQVTNGLDAIPGQFGGGGGAYIQQVAHRLPPGQIPVIVLSNDGGGVRLFQVAAQLGKDLVEGYPNRDGKPQLPPHPSPDVVGNHRAGAEKLLAAGHIQPALVQAKGLHPVGVGDIEFPGGGGNLQVAVIMGRDHQQVRASLLGLPDGLARGDAVCLGLIALGQDDAVAGGRVAADGHRLAPESGVVQALHRCVKIVHVHV